MITDKQIRFCDEYMIDLNATQAAIRAGYSKKTANEQGARLLANVSVQSYLSDAKKNISDINNDLANRVVQELEKIGFCNIQDYLDEDNVVKDLTTIERQTAAAISSVKKSITEFGTKENPGVKTVVELKLHDKISALEKLGRYTGLFEKDNNQLRPDIFQPMTDTQVDKVLSTLRAQKNETI